MKKLLEHQYLILIIRLLLGGLLIYASYDKILDPDAFGKAIWNYKIFARGISLGIATVLPWLELFAGAGILFGVLYRGATLLSFALMIVFTGGVVSGLARGLDISCGCFSLDPEVGKIGWQKLAENFLLIAIAGYLFFSQSTLLMLEQTLQTRQPAATGEQQA